MDCDILYLVESKKIMGSDNKSFEESLRQLTDIVNKMGGSETTLEESLKLFEDGIRLVNTCRNQLTEAEKKVRMLMNQNGNGAGELQNVVISNNQVVVAANNNQESRHETNIQQSKNDNSLRGDDIPF